MGYETQKQKRQHYCKNRFSGIVSLLFRHKKDILVAI